MSGPLNAPPPAADSPHRRSFKLRFARLRELGRSDVSLVKPFGLPSTVTDKFYRRQQPAPSALEAAALRRIHDMFQKGPLEKHPLPVTSAQEYGWHWKAASREAAGDRRLQHHIRDSAWLKATVRILYSDAQLKQR
ncbi:uncharacterized protein LOC132901956 [Amyelois transitella]|uniref:uncharacterized protein LOC132901956 n=1 Tax=Amyelois transitella TaxID=680683 RepID=UPI0029907DD0|nr:uncharacterized protein LOC132901956 [Amyelois transitella]